MKVHLLYLAVIKINFDILSLIHLNMVV